MSFLTSLMNSLGVTATRRNHALEHATVAVLLERFGFTRSLAGRSNTKGFHIVGNVSQDEVKSAADEALKRMRNGEAGLAVSPFCGTNIAITGILAGLLTLGLVGKKNRVESLPNVLLGGMVAVLVGQPLGRVAQKYVTTKGDLGNLEIDEVSPSGMGPIKGLWVGTSQSAGR